MKKNFTLPFSAVSVLLSFFLFTPLIAAACSVYTVPDDLQEKIDAPIKEKNFTSSTVKKMWGKKVRVAYTNMNQRVLLDTSDCSVLDIKTHTSTPIQTTLKNIWRDSGSETGAAEMIDIFSGENNEYTLIFTQINKKFQFKKIGSLTLASSEVPTISIKNRIVRINGEKYRIGRSNKMAVLRQKKESAFFLTLGDPGLFGEIKEDVATGMATVSRRFNGADRVMTTGDNFYPSYTIETATDSDYQKNFSDIYVRDWLRVPFLISLGNHDYDDNNLSAILNLHDRYKKWYLPSNYYSYQYPIKGNEKLVEFFILDTEMIDNGDEGTIAQLDWLDEKLENSSAQWKIIVGHHSPYSYGMHGDNSTIKELVVPIAREHNVDLFITGHDHDLQHIDHPNDDIAYIVNGAGSTLRDTSSGEMSEFALSEYGFVGLALDKGTLQILFFDADGKILYKEKIKK